MNWFLLISLVYFLGCEGASLAQQKLEDELILNDRPIIGLLSQEPTMFLNYMFREENYSSYIVASYVKNLESAGARVVPIMIGRDRSYYENLLKKLNGVLLPGGSASLRASGGYADASQYIYEIAQELNDNGNYFPLFGICLGFEIFIILASGRGPVENRDLCFSVENLALDFTEDYRDSKMFANVPEEISEILSNEKVTVNAHQFCITDKNMKAYNLSDTWQAMSYNKDLFGQRFISSLEHRRYPFYGVQFHPERSLYEWKASKNHPHTKTALKANRYFMDFFVNESRKSQHAFNSVEEENEHLIFNYTPTFTERVGSSFLQCYFFEPRGKSEQ